MVNSSTELPSELRGALALAAPYRLGGYVVLLIKLGQFASVLPMIALCGWVVGLYYLPRAGRVYAVFERALSGLLLVQGAEAAAVAGLIWMQPLPLVSALLLSASLLLANAAIGGLQCCSLALLALIAAAGVSSLVPGAALDPDALLSVPGRTVPGLVALAPELLLLMIYGMSFSVLGFRRVQQLKRAQRRQRASLAEQRERADRLQSYLPQSLIEHLADAPRGSRQRCWLLIVYVDLCDFTPLTERLEADALAEVLDGYLALMHRLATAADGVVAKVLGDGVLLFWRPGPGSDQGRRRSARQALQLVQALPRQLRELSDYWQQRGEPLRLAARAALTSGYCTLGDWGPVADVSRGVGVGSGRLEYTLIGTPVNLAARLQAFAAPDGAVLDDRTRLLLGDEAPFDSGRVVVVKGLGEQHIFELAPECQRNLTLVR